MSAFSERTRRRRLWPNSATRYASAAGFRRSSQSYNPAGRLPFHPYRKWYGAHWTLATLADIGYPGGDESLIPMREQVLEWLSSAAHERSIEAIPGLTRRCASQEANAVFYLTALALADDRVEELVSRLARWQWPDGGWNCDKRPQASNSSFMESLIPLRALALHARTTGSALSAAAVDRATGILLKRRLFRRQSDESVINPDFVKLHYPCYWHYDILFALKVMAESGLLREPRCREALDLLESKRLADGGFPAEGRYWRLVDSGPHSKWRTGGELVDWGPCGVSRSNDWVTADALAVLRAAHRLAVD